jgi:hypothetical protein
MSHKHPKNRKGTPAPRPEMQAARAATSETPVIATPAFAAPPIAASATSTTSTVPKTTISPEQRRRMVAEAAYYKAQRRGFRGDPVRDWTEAEAEIDAILLSRR